MDTNTTPSQSQTNKPLVSLSSVETQRSLRETKLNELRTKGIDPFPSASKRDMTLKGALALFSDEFKFQHEVTLCGFIQSKRGSGKIAFATVQDFSLPTGFQFIFKIDELKPEGQESLSFKDYQKLVDEGDYIQATGTLMRSQRGEPSLFVNSYRLLTKALRPLPNTMEDIEDKYRRRYIDMKLNPSVRELFIKKSRFWSATREYLNNHGFLEVQAPTLEHTTGGAEAEPFETHHNALDEDFYLRISSELFLKRYIVGGFEKVFDIDKNYRNEGISDEHLQEYTQLEFYWAYASYEDLLTFSEEMIKYVIRKTMGSLHLPYKDRVVDWSQKWPRMKYYDFIEHFGNIDLRPYKTVSQLRKKADELGLVYEDSAGFGRLVDLIYKKTARPKCIDPTWLTHFPAELTPLAKKDPQDPSQTLSASLLAYGSELTNQYCELNDPIDQAERFAAQQELREAGDKEAMMVDTDFINALEIAMPPTVGFSYSERLFSVLMQKSIRETTPFPLLRREKPATQKNKKSTMVAHSVILNNGTLESWQQLNTASHLASSFAAREGAELFFANESVTADNEVILMNIMDAIIIKQSPSVALLLELKNTAEKAGLRTVTFTRDMLVTSNDSTVIKNHAKQKSQHIEYLGVCIYGPISTVAKLTEHFDLWK